MGEIVSLLGAGLLQAFEPLNLGMIIAGCMAGLFIGAMPGLGSVNGVAILLPVTFLVPPTAAIIFLAALYYGAMYGGAISSITLGIPGASTAVATVFDGRPMAQKGLDYFDCPVHPVCTTARGTRIEVRTAGRVCFDGARFCDLYRVGR